MIADERLSVQLACRLLEVTRSGYYAAASRPPSARSIRHAWLTDLIGQIHAASRRTYGAPRVHAELRIGRGITVGHNAVAMLMRRAGLQGLPAGKRWRARPDTPTVADLVDRNFVVIEPDALWVTDITEHPTREGKLYCSVVLDAYSRRVVGWSIDASQTAALVVADATAVGHRVQLARVMPLLGSRRVDQVTTSDVAELVAALHAKGRKRETIRKSLTVLAQVLDFAGVKDNPARDRVHVRLPREEREEPSPPIADQIEAVLRLMPRPYALAILVLDATGMRVGELEEKGLRYGDLDEPNTRWRVRRAVEKGRRGRWVSLPPDLFAAVIATLPPREDRAAERPVFLGLTQERLRTAIARACKASGTPTWSPHDLRHRRISLWHRQGETWALIGARVGQRSLSVTADTYTHVLLDDRELDHPRLAAELGLTAA